MTTQTASTSTKPQRRWDIDWLRVLAVLLLFPFHVARIFNNYEPFYVKNAEWSDALTYFISIVHPWHMPLLFLLAGTSTWFALSFRSGGQYTKERFIRLLIPFIFGLLVIVPPQSYVGLISHSDYSGSFLEWYPSFFSIQGDDMDGYFLGGFTPAHLWFIALLFIFSLVALPLFLYLRRRDSGKRLIGGLAAFCSLPGGLFLLGVVPYVMYRLIDFKPNPLYFITYFILGYILFADARFEKSIDRHKVIALVLGPVLWLFVVYYLMMVGLPEGLPSWSVEVIRAYDQGIVPWFSLIAILGYGRLFLSFSNRFLRYTAEASYPAYILHQTVIVIIGFYVVQWQSSVLVKYATILVAALIITTLIYGLIVKRANVTRFLFGMRLKKKQVEEPAPQPSVA